MQAVAVYPASRQIKLIDFPQPGLLEPSQVRVRILEVGVCGTDKEIAHYQYGTPPKGSDFLIIGHEALGEVIEVGSNVEGMKEGDYVVPTVRRPCENPTCSACSTGRQDYCFSGRFTERGIKGRHGYMTEQAIVESQYLHPLLPGLRDVGVLTEPLTIARKALNQIKDVQDRLPWSCARPRNGEGTYGCRRALVLGAGPVGLLCAMTAVDAGFETIVYSRVGSLQQRVDIVQAIGARFVAAEQVNPSMLCEVVGEVDVVLEAVGASQLAFEVLELLGPNAIFVFTGVPGRKAPVEIETGTIMRNLVLKNQVLIGTVNAGPDDFRAAVQALGRFREKWHGVLRRMITGRFPPDKAPDLLRGGIAGIKNVVFFEGSS